ncbi:MAG: hypothetical protein IRY96_06405 [Burkholderiales bacterium]|nr:hypothetical protein [Burkholderiales bacterium]
MGSGRKSLLTGAIALIRGERHAAKALMRELDCSPRQATRILDEGRVPQEYQARFIAFLKRLRDRNQERIRALDEEIKLFEYQRAMEARRKAASQGDGGSA